MKFKLNGCLVAIFLFFVVSIIYANEGNEILKNLLLLSVFILGFFLAFERKKRIKTIGQPIIINLTAPKSGTLKQAQRILQTTNVSDEDAFNLVCAKLVELIILKGIRCKQLDSFLEEYTPVYHHNLKNLLKKYETDKLDEFIKAEALTLLPYYPSGNIVFLFENYEKFKNFDFSVFKDFDFESNNKSFFGNLKEILHSNDDKKIIASYAYEYAAILVKTYDTLRFNAFIIKQVKSIGDIDHLNGWGINPCNCSCCQNRPLYVPFEKTPALPRHIGCACKLMVWD